MTQNLTPAQQTQLENRDASGQFKAKEHGDVDDDTDVLGIGSAEDRFNRMMVMDDLESRRGDRAKQAQLSLHRQGGRGSCPEQAFSARHDRCPRPP